MLVSVKYSEMETTIVKVKEILLKSEVTDFYKDLIDKQSDSYSNLITVLLSLMVILVGSTWLWNFIIAKNQIKNELTKISEKIKKELREENLNSINQKYGELEQTVDKKLTENEANLARLYAVNCYNQGLHGHSVSWWITALGLYAKIDDHEFIRVSVDNILENIQKENWYSDHPEFDVSTAIENIQRIVPPVLSNEKTQILSSLRARLQ
jgi:hypothetical protein